MKVSDCCGASARMLGDNDCDTENFGICPECKEHCTYVEEDEEPDKNFSQEQLRIINNLTKQDENSN